MTEGIAGGVSPADLQAGGFAGVAKVLVHTIIVQLLRLRRLNAVHIHKTAAQCRGNGNGVGLEAQQHLQCLAGPGGIAGSHTAHHVKDVRFQIAGPHLHHQRRGDLGITAGGCQLIHFVL